MSDPHRTSVAVEEEALIRALVSTAPPPRGIDAPRAATALSSPLAERTRAAADGWPQLARCLGPEMASRFGAWADEHPLPTGTVDPWADGLAFQLSAISTRELDTDALMERQRGRTRAVVRRAPGAAAHVRPRRGPLLLVGRSRSRRGSRRRVVITLSTSPQHVRTWCIPRR